jgi:hypothetical protein
MDHYTAERLFIERQRLLVEAAERRQRLIPDPGRSSPARVWLAGRLRAAADRIDGRPQLQRV